jgi:hypothetical protein
MRDADKLQRHRGDRQYQAFHGRRTSTKELTLTLVSELCPAASKYTSKHADL